MPKFSVIVGAYRHEKTIGKLIESLKEQTFQDFEVIFADDGSDDLTLANILAYAPEWKYVTQRNKGMRLAKSLNNALRLAKGQYCLLVMGDSFLERDYLEILAEWVKPERIVNGIRIHVDNGVGVDVDYRLKKNYIPPDNVVLPVRPWQVTTGNGLCIPTRAFKLHGYLDEDFEGYGGEDNEIIARLYFKGFTVWSVPLLKLYHQHHTEKEPVSGNLFAKKLLAYAS